MNNEAIDTLNGFLGGEISAVESYKQAINNLDNAQLTAELKQLQTAHAMRAQKIRQKVEELGGEPVESSGLWGSLAQTATRGASAFGEQTALSALVEGERQGLAQYRSKMAAFDGDLKRFVVDELVHDQEQTEHALEAIREYVTHDPLDTQRQ